MQIKEDSECIVFVLTINQLTNNLVITFKYYQQIIIGENQLKVLIIHL